VELGAVAQRTITVDIREQGRGEVDGDVSDLGLLQDRATRCIETSQLLVDALVEVLVAPEY
jgi:hypothetical protein